MPAFEPGAVLCALSDIPDGQAKGIEGGQGERTVKVLVARRGDRAFGYYNACPHVGVPLDWGDDRFMSLDGQHLQCGTHGALFRVEDGFCISGPCQGRRLRPLAVSVDADGRVVAD